MNRLAKLRDTPSARAMAFKYREASKEKLLPMARIFIGIAPLNNIVFRLEVARVISAVSICGESLRGCMNECNVIFMYIHA